MQLLSILTSLGAACVSLVVTISFLWKSRNVKHEVRTLDRLRQHVDLINTMEMRLKAQDEKKIAKADRLLGEVCEAAGRR